MHAKVPRDTSIGTYRHLFYCYSFLLLALLDHFVLTRHNVLVPDGEGTSGQSLERAVAATLNHGVAVRLTVLLGPEHFFFTKLQISTPNWNHV